MKQPLIFILDKNSQRGNMLMYRMKGGEFRNIQLFTSEKECLYRIMNNGSPAVIIADTGTDLSSATGFIAEVKQASPSIHIIFYSDTDDEQLAGMLLSAGASDYILRTPNSEAGLRELIKNIHYITSQEVLNNRFF